MGRPRLLATLLAVAVLLTGCWDQLAIEDTAYVVSLAVDQDERGGYLWTFRTVETLSLPIGTLSTYPAPGPRNISSSLVTVHAVTILQAIQVAQASLSRIMTLSHLGAVTFGERLARAGITPVLNQLLRHHEIRRSLQLTVAAGEARVWMRQSSPTGEVNALRYIEGVNVVEKRLHLAPAVRLQQCRSRLETTGADPYLPLVAVNSIAAGPNGSVPPPTGDEPLAAGTLPRVGGNPVEWAGAAIFRRDRYVGSLTIAESYMLLALQGQLGKGNLSVPDPLEPGETISFRAQEENKPTIRIGFVGGEPQAAIHLQLEAEIVSMSGSTDYSLPENSKKLEAGIQTYLREAVATPLIQKAYGKWGADPLGLGIIFRRRFGSYPAWERYDWHSHVKGMTVKTDIVVVVRRFGMLLSQP